MPADAVGVLIAGGTIGMSGSPAQLSAEAMQDLQHHIDELQVEVFRAAPSVHFSWRDALGLSKHAIELAGNATPVVVTHGTDLLEEVAFLCDVIYGGDAAIVFTGAMRTASAPGADGPANLRVAITVAASAASRGPGVLVAFAGTIHAGRFVRKADSTSVDAFASPAVRADRLRGGGSHARVWRPERHPAVSSGDCESIVEILSPGPATGSEIAHAAAEVCDGLVISVPGAGHAPPLFLAAVKDIAQCLPVVAVPRPWRGTLLYNTYGFSGAEIDLRASHVIWRER